MEHKKVLQHIQDYGYIITDLNSENILGYHCFNPLSESTFILVVLDQRLHIPTNIEAYVIEKYKLNLPCVYLILVDENIEEVIAFAQSTSNQSKAFLIYDPDDEVEFFLKDLWNTIVALTSK